MKLRALLFLFCCLFMWNTPALNAQGEALPKAVLTGIIEGFEGIPGGRRIRCLAAQLTSFRPEMIRTRVASDGAFRIEVPVYHFQEIWLQYLGQSVPLLVGPGEQLHLQIDARRFSEHAHPWATIKLSGGHTETNRQLLIYRGNFPYRIEEAGRGDGRREPEAYKTAALALLDASLEELKSYRRGYFINDTAYAWAVQELRYTTARNLHVQARLRAARIGEKHLLPQLAATGYFDVWEQFQVSQPAYVLSWAYRQFLSTYILFLNDKMTIALAPDYGDMDEAARKEFAYIYGDSIVMAGVEYLVDRPPSKFRDYTLALYCGNTLQYNAPVIQLSYVQAIGEEPLRELVREKYEKSRSKKVELDNPELLVTPPDTVRDIVSWAGRHFKGQTVLLDFWAVWCGSCLYSIENDLPQLVEEFKDKPVVFLLVGIGSEKNFLIERANRFPVETLHLFPTTRQEEVLQSQYGLAGLPRYILLDRQGAIVEDRAPRPGPGLAARIRTLLNN